MTSAEILETSAAMVDFWNQVSYVPRAFQKISSSTCSIFSSVGSGPAASGFWLFCGGLSKQFRSCVSPSFSSTDKDTQSSPLSQSADPFKLKDIPPHESLLP